MVVRPVLRVAVFFASGAAAYGVAYVFGHAVGPVSLSSLQLTVCLMVIAWAIVVAFGVGLGTGRQRERDEVLENARQQGVDPYWLEPRGERQ